MKRKEEIQRQKNRHYFQKNTHYRTHYKMLNYMLEFQNWARKERRPFAVHTEEMDNHV